MKGNYIETTDNVGETSQLMEIENGHGSKMKQLKQKI